MEKYLVNLGKIGRNIEINLIDKIENRPQVKPYGGLWCCRENTPQGYSWRDWCTEEYPYWLSKEDAIISIKTNAKIYTIDSLETLNKLPLQTNLGYISTLATILDFEEIAKNYDLIDFRLSSCPPLRKKLYTIDCDCCLILNKECIENIENPKEITIMRAPDYKKAIFEEQNQTIIDFDTIKQEEQFDMNLYGFSVDPKSKNLVLAGKSIIDQDIYVYENIDFLVVRDSTLKNIDLESQINYTLKGLYIKTNEKNIFFPKIEGIDKIDLMIIEDANIENLNTFLNSIKNIKIGKIVINEKEIKKVNPIRNEEER